ncbi:MAG: sodium/glutamate symporter [Candidatus Promineifilaceae bacterium]|nr:sodium/glutamate symporter [Candidatus Promineifilaceae bacterium]
MTIELPFLAAVVLAGFAYGLGYSLVHRIPFLQRYAVPAPLLGGLLAALLLLALRLAGLFISVPVAGEPLSFLVGLLTANMGLHLSLRIIRQGAILVFLFLAAGVVILGVQLALVLPLAATVYDGTAPLLPTAFLIGPLSFFGAPFTLNPPSQIGLLAPTFELHFPDFKLLAQGNMMLGVLAVLPLGTLLAERLLRRVEQDAPTEPLSKRKFERSLSTLGIEETFLITLILGLIVLATALQEWLLQLFPALMADHLPVVIIAYVLGAVFRLSFDRIVGEERFPDKALTALLVGPTMSFVLAYALMSAPLYLLQYITPLVLVAAVVCISANAIIAWLSYPLFARFTHPYYAAVISTALFALSTGWGPVAIGFLRRFMDRRGTIEPMPEVMPPNSFYFFPWIVILLGWLLL